MVKELENVASDKAFFIFNGPKINNLYELAEVFENISDASFRHHVTAQKNDFSNWARDVIGDSELAAKLMSAKNKSKMAYLARERISQLETLEAASHTKALLKFGMLDFLLGIIIGVIAGVILVSFL